VKDPDRKKSFKDEMIEKFTNRIYNKKIGMIFYAATL